MMVSVLLLALGQSGPPMVRDTQAWQAYAKAIAASSAIEVHYTVTVEKGKQQQGVIKARGPNAIVWIVQGQSRVVWNGEDGLWVNESMKVYLYFRKKSEFFANCPITIPGLVPMRGRFVNSIETSSKSEAGRDLNIVRFGDQGVDTIDFDRWAFDSKTKLPVWVIHQWGGIWDRGDGIVRYDVNLFDLAALVGDEDFSLAPPIGYRQLGE